MWSLSRPTVWSALKTSPRKEMKSKCYLLILRVRMMPECGHVFHTGCIDQWFQTKPSSEIHCPHWNIKLLTKNEIREKMMNEEMLNREEKKEEVKHFDVRRSIWEERRVRAGRDFDRAWFGVKKSKLVMEAGSGRNWNKRKSLRSMDCRFLKKIKILKKIRSWC